jgi:redox-sensitive bicupin YhaK (pirin superfamily)
MIKVRKSEERGHFNHGWLDTRHTFSFSEYYEPDYMHFRHLRVINEDRVAPGQGFGTHPHKDMEILTYVLDGELEHKDSMGTGSIIRPGDIQKMSAGTGILHSEFNASKSKPVHFLQIWIVPDDKGVEPEYWQQSVPLEKKHNNLCLIASQRGREDSVHVYQDVNLFASVLDAGKELTHTFEDGRYGWVQVARGKLSLNGVALSAGDGAGISAEKQLAITASENAEFLLFDLA